MLALDFFVSPHQDIMVAKQIVEECVTSNRYVYLGRPWSVVTTQSFGPRCVVVKLSAQAYVLDLKYRDEYTSTVTERVLQAFREKNILLAGEAPKSPAGALPPDLPRAAGTAALSAPTC